MTDKSIWSNLNRPVPVVQESVISFVDEAVKQRKYIFPLLNHPLT